MSDEKKTAIGKMTAKRKPSKSYMIDPILRIQDREQIQKIKEKAASELNESGRYGVHYADDKIPDSKVHPTIAKKHNTESHVAVSKIQETARVDAILLYLQLSASAHTGKRPERATRFLDLALEQATESESKIIAKTWQWFNQVKK